MDQDEKKAPLEATKPKPRPRPVAVRVVGANRPPTVLVQWQAGKTLKRAYVPSDQVVDGHCERDVLEAGANVGVEWEKFVTVAATPEGIANGLRRVGIFTLADLKRDLVKAKQVAFEQSNLDWAVLIRSVEQEDK